MAGLCGPPRDNSCGASSVSLSKQGGAWEAQISGKETLQGDDDQNMSYGGGGRER